MVFGCYLFVVLAAYLLGSIPTGFLAAKAKGIDIRSVGSGNIGATNVFRFVGKPAGAAVLLIDGAKGFLACAAVPQIALRIFSASTDQVSAEALSIAGGLAAVLGHNYTCWLSFKGGKGIATSAGVLLGWVPKGLLISFLTWLFTFAATRYVSVASLAAAVVLPFAVWLTQGSRAMIAITAVLSALAIYKHRTNIERLRAGTEHRFTR